MSKTVGRMGLGFAAVGACAVALTVGSVSLAAVSSQSSAHAAATKACPNPAKGSPVTWWQLGDENPQQNPTPENLVAAKLAATRINCSGGVAGHVLKVPACNSLADPNRAAACAKKAAEDKTTLAVWVFSQQAKVIYPILAKAKLAVVAPEALQPLEYQYPRTFAVAAGFQGLATGDAIFAHKLLGAKKVSVVTANCVPCQGLPDLIAGGIKAAGYSASQLSLTKSVYFPFDVTDMSSYAQQGADGVDAIMCFCGRSFTVRFVQTARRLGIKTPILAVDDNVPPSDAKAMGSAGKDVYFSGHYDWNNAESRMYRALMLKAKADPTGTAQSAWIGAKMLQDAGKQAQAKYRAVNSANLQKVMNSWTKYSTGGQTPPLDYKALPWKGSGGQLPRMVNRTVTFFEVVNGKLVQKSSFATVVK